MTAGGWTSGPCAALEHRFVLVAPGEAGEAFAPLVAPLSSPEPVGGPRLSRYRVRPGPGSRLTLTVDGVRLAQGRTAEDLLARFAWHVNQTAVSTATAGHVVLHAAAAVRDGVAVVLAADQECGKTTTVAGLLRAGFDYVTDEAVALRPADGTIVAFPKALSLDPGSWPLFPECRPDSTGWLRQWHVPADRLGARVATGPVPAPRVVVFPRYVAGSTTAVEGVSPGAAVRELARMTFEFRGNPARHLATLGAVAERATAVRLRIGSLDAAVTAVATLVDAAGRARVLDTAGALR